MVSVDSSQSGVSVVLANPSPDVQASQSGVSVVLQTIAPPIQSSQSGVSVVLCTLPEAATELGAIFRTARVDLTWTDNVTGVSDGYRIERQLDDGAWVALDTVDPGEVSYTDSTIIAGSAYVYRVVALNGLCETASVTVTRKEKTVTKETVTKMIADLAVEVDGAIPRLYTPDTFRRAVDSADTPARLILPSTEGDLHTLEPMGTGRLSRMEWIVKDLLLYRPVEEGMGWLEVGYALDGYIDSYAEKLTEENHSATGFCSVPAEVLSVSFLVGVQTFVNRNYYGVMTTLRIMEPIE